MKTTTYFIAKWYSYWRTCASAFNEMKKWQKECSPRSSSTIICIPTMAGGEYTVMLVILPRSNSSTLCIWMCILSSLSSTTSSSPCRRSLHKKNFSVSKFRMSLASMFYSRLDMFISLWTINLFEEFLNFWREKRKRGETLLLWSRIEKKCDEKLIMNNNNDII